MKKNISLSQYLEELETLVNTDSGSDDLVGIAKIADFFENRFQSLHWIVRRHHFLPHFGSCLEITNGEWENFDILLVGHMDTVFPKGTARQRPFRVEKDRAYGPGVVDMKSGLLSMLYALQTASKLPRVCVALNSDEEISSISSAAWLQQLAKRSRIALVLEPARANGALVKRRKGLARFDLEFHGVAAHAGIEPEKGCSAINELAHWILELHQLTCYEKGTTVNIGVVSGGSGVNVVAAHAKAGMEVRLEDPMELDRITSHLNALQTQPKTAGVTGTFKLQGYRPPMIPTLDTEALCSLVKDFGAELGLQISFVATGGGSDANFTASAGAITLDGFGPVGGAQHSDQEYLEIPTILPRVDLLRRIVESIGVLD